MDQTDEEYFVHHRSLFPDRIGNYSVSHPPAVAAVETADHQEFSLQDASYSFLARFIELLPQILLRAFSATSKSMYKMSCTYRGIQVTDLLFTPVVDVDRKTHMSPSGELTLICNGDQLPAHLVSYLRIFRLSVMENKIYGKIPPNYPVLVYHTHPDNQLPLNLTSYMHPQLQHLQVRYGITHSNPTFVNSLQHLNQILDGHPTVHVSIKALFRINKEAILQTLKMVRNLRQRASFVVQGPVETAENTYAYLFIRLIDGREMASLRTRFTTTEQNEKDDTKHFEEGLDSLNAIR